MVEPASREGGAEPDAVGCVGAATERRGQLRRGASPPGPPSPHRRAGSYRWTDARGRSGCGWRRQKLAVSAGKAAAHAVALWGWWAHAARGRCANRLGPDRRPQLDQALGNLVDNALRLRPRHSPHPGKERPTAASRSTSKTTAPASRPPSSHGEATVLSSAAAPLPLGAQRRPARQVAVFSRPAAHVRRSDRGSRLRCRRCRSGWDTAT